jgi:Ca2+/Na+ antiporter
MKLLKILSVIILLALILIIAVFYSAKARRFRDINADTMSRCLYFMVFQYSLDYNDMCPSNMGALWDYCPGAVYLLYGSKTPCPQSAADVDNGLCDYLYVAKGKRFEYVLDEKGNKLPGNNRNSRLKEIFPILYTKDKIFGGKHLILLSNGEVIDGDPPDILPAEAKKPRSGSF